MEFLIVAALIGLVPASIAKNKGHSFGTWWFYGFLLFIVALPHSLLLKPNAVGIERAELATGKRRCSQCAEFIQATANLCRYCGSPTTAVSATVPTVPRPKKQRPVGHIGTVPGCLLILLATMGVTAVVSRSSSPDRPVQQRAPARRAPARKPTLSPPPSFDAQLAAQGKELHARLLVEANVQQSYLAGAMVGAITREPKAWIAVPMDAWKALGNDERAQLMYYAASLVEPMRKDPLAYSGIPASGATAETVRKNASQMKPRDWVIWGGPLHSASGIGPFDILADELVASGADHDPATPEEVIAELHAAGLGADLPWRQSDFDGVWNAILRGAFGDNEVSCLLESRSSSAIESVELEAEVYRSGQLEAEVFRAFAQAAQVLCKEPGLREAIEARKDWASWKWQLKRERYASGGGFGFVLRYR